MCADLRGAITAQASLLAVGVGLSSVSATSVLQVDIVTALLGTIMSLAVGSFCSAGQSAATMKTWRM